MINVTLGMDFLKFVDNLFICCYLIKISKVHLWPCTRSFASTVDVYFRRSKYFVLRLPVWTYLMLVGKAYYPPIVSWCVNQSWHMPILGLFIITQCVFQHLGLLGKSRGLHSVLEVSPFDCICSTFSRGGSKFFRKFDLNFCVSWWVPPSYILVVLCSCCRFSNIPTAFLDVFLWTLACP